MKTDLITSVIAAVVGTVAAFFLCNLLIPKIENFSYTTLDPNLNYTLSDPDIEVFNYRAVDPTVEVWVGQCSGDNCDTAIIIDTETNEEPETTPEAETPEEVTPGPNEESENGVTD